jgi:hypothetical protein
VFSPAMGLPLEPLTAHDIGQAAGEKDYRYDQKKDINHVRSLPLNLLFDTAVYSRIHYSVQQVKRSSKGGPAASRFRKNRFADGLRPCRTHSSPAWQVCHRHGSDLTFGGGTTQADATDVPVVYSSRQRDQRSGITVHCHGVGERVK